MRVARVGRWLVAAALVWVLVLWLGGWALSGAVGDGVARRLGASLEGEATVGDASLSLLRGHLSLKEVSLRREDGGHLSIEVRSVDAELAPLGAVLWDRDPGLVHVAGLRFEVSAAAMLQVQKGQRPFHIGGLLIEDAKAAAMPLGFLPGLARAELEVTRARTGAFTLRTPLSWVFALEELDARLTVAGGSTLELAYRAGKLRLAGTILGGPAVEVPFAIPVLEPAREVEQLVDLGQQLGRELAGRIIIDRAGAWIQKRLLRSLVGE